mmetsp:Transcript_3783/g.9916  ORF Transcript_3783/g.9916 Transcript_3783/m.9916 type:complete len:1092 (+) Transcript_3783:131-3406(+)|eukprot:CAMPEP_0197183784 /NCGR_PEP_ID=MMETSP1423-20130617/8358_1 /TAXON_ID=476441 /ORGANISM="Pseudo-nitzschia heimii, Strain UNC1101" /LENGTH=1091 /DNA_ID=CAMNT_0042634413 /DNA_START=48 /DNA_END=3323 /DNA_ORIENTATION=+
MRLRLLLSALTWFPAVAKFTCTICIGGVGLTKPDGIVTTKEGQSSTCEALTTHIASLSQEACESLQHIATAPCGCPGYEASDNPLKISLATNVREPSGSIPVPVESESGLGLGASDNPFKDSLITSERVPPESVSASVSDQVPVESESGSFVCPICKTGEMKNPGAFTIDSAGIPISCQKLHDTRQSIAEDACARVQSFASAPCGCDMKAPPTVDVMIVNESVPYTCNVCGNGVIGNPSGIVVNDRGVGKSCAELEADKEKIPSNMCASLQNTALISCECVFGESLDKDISGEPIKEVASQFSPFVEVEKTEAENPSSAFEIKEVLSQCSICGDGTMMNPDGIVTTRNGVSARCDDLEANPKEITQAACANIQSMARQPCECLSLQEESGVYTSNASESFECSICGGGAITIPDGIVITPEGQAARCNALQANAITIPEEICPEIQQLSKDVCGCTESETVKATEEYTAPWSGQNTDESSSERFECPICGDGLFVTEPEGTISTEDGMTCAQYLTEAAQGKIDEEQCSILQQTSAEACGCKPPPTFPTDAPTSYECQLCGEGWEIGSPDAEVMLPNYTKMSCATLQERAETGLIHSSQCARYVPIAQQHCNCVKKPYEVPLEPPKTWYDCNICGSDLKVTNPSGIVNLPNQPDRTCIDLMTEAAYGKMDEHQCSLLHPYVKQACGCADPYATIPSQPLVGSQVESPSLSETDPLPTQQPSAKRGDCFQDLGKIQALERAVEDTSITRMYILCPGTTFDLGSWTNEGEIKDGQPFIALRPNVIYQCGHDGSRMNDCILRGGDFGLASYYEVYDGIHETVPGVEIHGLTFESQNVFSVILKSAGDILFTGCAFKGNSNNVPVLIQLEETERFGQELEDVGQIVTFQDCVFRDNFADDSLSFPGIIENTFNSELIVKNSLFQNNVYGTNNNLADSGYAIRSFGSLTLESTCFIDNVFLNNGPVLLYGAQYSAYDNYVQSSQRDLTCELGALFSSQDDMLETDPSCESSDANICAFTQGPTSSPSVAPKFPVVPTQTVEVAPTQTMEKKSPGSSSTSSTESNEVSSSAFTLGRRSTNVVASFVPMLLVLLSINGL